MNAPKVVRDGKVAVLYSPGFGAGWSTWSTGEHANLLFHPELVAAVEADPNDEANMQTDTATRLWPGVYTGGMPLVVAWLPVGARFRIHEYDGSESVECCEALGWEIA